MQLARIQREGAVIIVLSLDRSTHFTQRANHTAHRALLDRGITIQCNGKWLPGQDAAQQAGRGAGIAGIQRFLRGGKAVQPHTFHDDLVFADFDRHTHFTKTVNGGEAVFSHQETGDMGRAAGQCAQHNRAV